MFPDERPKYNFDTASDSSHLSDFYDDANPENKFNNSRKYLRKDDILVTKMSVSRKIPSLKSNLKSKLKNNKDQQR